MDGHVCLRHLIYKCFTLYNFFYVDPLNGIFQEINMGQKCSDTRGITFEDVVVPKEVSA